MADWVHCNICFHQPGSDRRKFSLTSCGHIYCSHCLAQTPPERCRMCKLKFTAVVLSGDMRPEVEMFMTNPEKLVKKHNDIVLKVQHFQQGHRQLLTTHNRELISKQKMMLEAQEKKIETLQKENFELKQYIQNMKSHGAGNGGGQRSRQGTPVSGVSISQSRHVSPGNKRLLSQAMSSPHERTSSPHKMAQSLSSHSQVMHSTSSPHGLHRTHKSPYFSSQPNLSQSANCPSQIQKKLNHTITSQRISVRAPPSNGRIGPINGTPEHLKLLQQQQQQKHLISLQPMEVSSVSPANSQIHNYVVHHSSPMTVSPNYTRSSTPTSQSLPIPRKQRPFTPGTVKSMEQVMAECNNTQK